MRNHKTHAHSSLVDRPVAGADSLQPLPSRSEVEAALQVYRQAFGALDQASKKLLELLPERLQDFVADEPEWTTLAKAAHYAGVTEETMALRVRRHGLGVRVGRAYRVDMRLVRAQEQGRPYTPLKGDGMPDISGKGKG